jgi:hypothetical protein
MTQLKIKIWAYDNKTGGQLCLMLDKNANIEIVADGDDRSILQVVGSEKRYNIYKSIFDLINDIDQQIEDITGNEAYIVSKNNR